MECEPGCEMSLYSAGASKKSTRSGQEVGTGIQGIQVQITVRTDKTRVAGDSGHTTQGHTRSIQHVGTRDIHDKGKHVVASRWGLAY